MSSTGFNGNLSEDASTKVLGDASKGYIVNVVREKGEEAVRIPPSISAKLKVHQVFPFRSSICMNLFLIIARANLLFGQSIPFIE